MFLGKDNDRMILGKGEEVGNATASPILNLPSDTRFLGNIGVLVLIRSGQNGQFFLDDSNSCITEESPALSLGLLDLSILILHHLSSSVSFLRSMLWDWELNPVEGLRIKAS